MIEIPDIENLVKKIVLEDIERQLKYGLDFAAKNNLQLNVNADIKVDISREDVENVLNNILSNDNIYTLDQLIRQNVGKVIRKLVENCESAMTTCLIHAEKLLDKGFVIKDGHLIYKDKIYATKVTSGTVTFDITDLNEEYKDKFYVENIRVSIYPFFVSAKGYHPHLNRTGNYCTGSVSTIEQFIDSFPQIFETVYVYSMQPGFDMGSELYESFLKLVEEKEASGWGGEW
jgi:hypothetical protein